MVSKHMPHVRSCLLRRVLPGGINLINCSGTGAAAGAVVSAVDSAAGAVVSAAGAAAVAVVSSPGAAAGAVDSGPPLGGVIVGATGRKG